MNAHQEISALLDEYFAGLYTGDVSKLRRVFTEQAVLCGQVKGQPYRKLLGDYLSVVEHRESPQARGEPFSMRVISVQIHGAIALAVVRCPMLGFDYIDYLSLVREGGRWAVVTKVFTHWEG